MYDAGKVLSGLAVFVLLFASPVWYSMTIGERGKSPELVIPASAGNKCIMPKEEMVAQHMALLDLWRNSVVREGNRIYEAEDGAKYNMSLSNTCLKCHSNKAEFCDRCHDYAGVDPFCWDCHVDPGEYK